jgi:cellulose synthase/poly-beta-1,6-N-acetylglucosamine synthase-like glycosyltransferase
MRPVEYNFVHPAHGDRSVRERAPAPAPQAVDGPLERERKFLLKLGLAKPFVETLVERAMRNGTTLEAELLAEGRIREDAYYGVLAKVLDLPFWASIDARTVADKPGIDSQLRQPRMVRCNLADRAPTIAIVPSAREILDGGSAIVHRAGVRDRVVVTTPSALREAVWEAGAARRVDEAANLLFDTAPHFSARIVLSGGQGFLAGLALAIFCVLLLVNAGMVVLATHIFLSISYFLALVFRGFAIHLGTGLSRPKALGPASELPVYTILVPLYQESALAAQLVRRLDRIDWPRSKLDIKLICEATDIETIAALKQMNLRPEYDVVRVPDMQPRTKPKALNYGLVAARGDYVVIYDAEDRPHPEQLLEAYAHFQRAPKNVACLQAPLIVANVDESWVSGLFAIEYAGLFRRILPLLGAAHLPMPLGGTSNHFRTDILRGVGGWDPYNVTEDADLGHRLHRLGYRSEMITRPTLEDAPTETGVWLGQRGRWFKGWMQTWLVLMRDPGKMLAEFGFGGALAFHAMISGMLISALGHPLIIGFLAVSIWHALHSVYTTPLQQFLFILDGMNTAGAYLLFTTMGRQAMIKDERKRLGGKWRWVPVYWLMMSYAAWKALGELHSNPFFWKKTPHRPVKVKTGATSD